MPANDTAGTEAACSAPPGTLVRRSAEWLTSRVLPLGLFALLTGLLWVGDRSAYHQLFYWLVVLPVIALAIARRDALVASLRSPIFLAFVAFAGYMAASIAWSGSEDGTLALLKRPLYVAVLFVACAELARSRPAVFELVLRGAAIFAVGGGAVALLRFGLDGAEDRFASFGALYNPLLTSHVFGFFLSLWVAYWIAQRRFFAPAPIAAVAILGALILATHSRTPLVALTMTVMWLSLLAGDKRGIVACLTLAGAGVLLALAWPEAIVQRGLSHRPEIWAEALRLIGERPVFGHGYEHPLRIPVAGIAEAFRDPHNMSLSVLYQGGAVGLALWAGLYAAALTACWRGRRHAGAFICSAPLVYGLFAGMTEGGSFLSRPKEHWFIIWIPLALVAAVTSARAAAIRTAARPPHSATVRAASCDSSPAAAAGPASRAPARGHGRRS